MCPELQSAQLRRRRKLCAFDMGSTSSGMVQPSSAHMAVHPCTLVAGRLAVPCPWLWLSFMLAPRSPAWPRAGAERRKADSNSPSRRPDNSRSVQALHARVRPSSHAWWVRGRTTCRHVACPHSRTGLQSQ